MKNITISVDDELWKLVRDSAADQRKSMNAFIREALSRTVRRTHESAAERFVALAKASGPAPQEWTWNRDEIYEDEN